MYESTNKMKWGRRGWGGGKKKIKEDVKYFSIFKAS